MRVAYDEAANRISIEFMAGRKYVVKREILDRAWMRGIVTLGFDSRGGLVLIEIQDATITPASAARFANRIANPS